MADLLQDNLAPRERLDKHGTRLYNLEKLDIPHKVSQTVNEIVTDAVDWAMQAPLRDRFRDLPIVDIKEILQQRMFKDDFYKANNVHNDLYEALQKSLELDYSNQRLAEQDEDHKKQRKRRTLGASGSSQLPPPPPPPSVASAQQSMAWTTSDTRYELTGIAGAQELSPSDDLMHDDSAPDEQVHVSDDQDSRDDHTPVAAASRKDWWKPVPEEERPVTPEPAWTILPSNVSDANPEGDQVRINVNRPLPLGGPPGHVIIQTEFFFNKDLEYMRFGNKGSMPVLSIFKMKVARYPDFGLELLVSEQMWIEDVCTYDISAKYGIAHWWFNRQKFYIDRHDSPSHEQTNALTTKNENLKAQMQTKMKSVTKDHVKPTVLAPGKHAIDVEPIPPRNRNNREVHLDYLKHLKESVKTLREIVEEAKVERPLDRPIVFASRYTKHSQELLEYAIGCCPKFNSLCVAVYVYKYCVEEEYCGDQNMRGRTYRPLVFGLKLFKTYDLEIAHGSGFCEKMFTGSLDFGMTTLCAIMVMSDNLCDSDTRVAFRKHTPKPEHMDSRSLMLYQQNPEQMMKSSTTYGITLKCSGNPPNSQYRSSGLEEPSMVTVPIHQDTSLVPLMTTPVIDLTMSQPVSTTVQAPLPTSTTTVTTITTTTSLPPPPPQPQQSTADPILVRHIGELKQHMADLLQVNLALGERLEKHGTRLYNLEKLDIPHKVSQAVDEIVTDAVDWAMQAPLRARFGDLPTINMKEILQQRMFEDNSYKTNNVHKDLYEALQKSLELDYSQSFVLMIRSPPPPAGASGAPGTLGASRSSQLLPPPPPPSTSTSGSTLQ
ncbi:hypothetical protein Tco_0542624 [Tanacetum coccineum]